MSNPNTPSMPPVDRTVAALRARVGSWRQAADSVALVPTMGALHEGHLALIGAARARAARVTVSIFVNPAQFAPTEDLASYPRDEAADLRKLAGAGVDAVFAPAVAEMYPSGFATAISVSGPALGLETDFRPNFFGGVATVVAKLLLVGLPDIAIFGEKDFQQLAVVKRMVADLAIPVTIVGHPTVREPDGLALSSRNAYLSPAERLTAPALHRVLEKAAGELRAGAAPEAVLAAARDTLAAAGFRIDYVELRAAETLSRAVDPGKEPLRFLGAAWLGRTRLIDNVAV